MFEYSSIYLLLLSLLLKCPALPIHKVPHSPEQKKTLEDKGNLTCKLYTFTNRVSPSDILFTPTIENLCICGVRGQRIVEEKQLISQEAYFGDHSFCWNSALFKPEPQIWVDDDQPPNIPERYSFRMWLLFEYPVLSEVLAYSTLEHFKTTAAREFLNILDVPYPGITSGLTVHQYGKISVHVDIDPLINGYDVIKIRSISVKIQWLMKQKYFAFVYNPKRGVTTMAVAIQMKASANEDTDVIGGMSMILLSIFPIVLVVLFVIAMCQLELRNHRFYQRMKTYPGILNEKGAHRHIKYHNQ